MGLGESVSKKPAVEANASASFFANANCGTKVKCWRNPALSVDGGKRITCCEDTAANRFSTVLGQCKGIFLVLREGWLCKVS